MLIFGYETMSR